jgi:uncharacterized protein (TIGR02266 family)
MARKTGADRRQHPRYDVKIKVDYRTMDMFLSNYVTNISKGGVFIQTENPLPLQSEIHLTLSLPELGATIEAKGKVAWTYDIKKGTSHIAPGMGIKFVDLPPQQKTLLEDYLKKLSDFTVRPRRSS